MPIESHTSVKWGLGTRKNFGANFKLLIRSSRVLFDLDGHML